MERLSAYRIFIASPGGLEDERRAFRQALLALNEDDAFDRGCVFIPFGWEQTLAGTGVPQELINRDIDRSDFLILVLCDRWGTPPADDGPYTSGTEEEFHRAMACLKDADRPMREVVVLFKGVSTRQLSDPGPELSKVLGFKHELEERKTVLYSTFDSEEEFRRHIRRHAHSWMRDLSPAAAENRGGSPGLTDPDSAADADPGADGRGQDHPMQDAPTDGDADGSRGDDASVGLGAAMDLPDDDSISELLDRARKLSDEGQILEAESLYARAVTDRSDVDALTGFARFLRRTGRLAKATEVSTSLLAAARAQRNPKAEIEALSNLAIIDRKRGRLREADSAIDAAMTIADALGQAGREDLAFCHDQKGLTSRKRGMLGEALTHHEAALAIRRAEGDARSTAMSLNNISPLLRMRNRISEATEMQDEALGILSELGYTRGLASAYANRGELHELLDETKEAEECFQKSYAANTQLGNPEGLAMNLMQLGRLALSEGDVQLAERYAEQGLASEDVANRPEGKATALQLNGLVLAAKGELKKAADELTRASEVYGRCDHVIGLAFTLNDLARVRLQQRRLTEASATVARAKRTAEGVEHHQLWEKLRLTQEDIDGHRG